jgi:hypothetical protein
MRLLPSLGLLPLSLLLACRPVFATTPDTESWNLHGQVTYVRQWKPAFPSPYEGPNSLHAASETSYSFTATASLGLRLGPATEAYFDPEVAQGTALSGLLGLAGFPNGELAKTSGSRPTFYRARLFVRHTFDLGGETEAVASAALAYVEDGWALNAARFEVPRQPNQLRLDTLLLRRYGDQVELARDYALAGQPGTVRVLAFRLHAVMARYDDALARADAQGGVPVLDDVRGQVPSKTGVGAAVAHRLMPDLGLFACWMQADGKTETYAFTEADRSASVKA